MIAILSFITIAYLLFVSVQDMRERVIYTFPANVLTVVWGVVAIQKMTMPAIAVVGVIAGYLMLYVLFNKLRIWGEGDSDLFLLSSSVFLAVISAKLSIGNIIWQIILFALVLVIALIAGFVEAKVKKTKLDKSSSIALAPGFLVVICAMLMKGVILC